jgi:hypothetical protein
MVTKLGTVKRQPRQCCDLSLLMPKVGRHELRNYGEELKIVANDNWLPDEKQRQQ